MLSTLHVTTTFSVNSEDNLDIFLILGFFFKFFQLFYQDGCEMVLKKSCLSYRILRNGSHGLESSLFNVCLTCTDGW